MSASVRLRREAIVQQVCDSGRVTIKDLARMLDVSEATARRDLKLLATDGQLELIYGGATLPRTVDFSFHSKVKRNIEAKRAIGRLAAQLVGDGDQIFLDSGTTCAQMIPHLRAKQNLLIIANSTRLAMDIDAPGLKIILLGGHYRPERLDTVGPLAIRTLGGLRGYLTFMGTDGLCMDFGPTASDMESAHLHALVVANARETILLADHSKFLSPSLYKIVDFKDISRIVTDRRPSDDWMVFLESEGIDVIYPDAAIESLRPPSETNANPLPDAH